MKSQVKERGRQVSRNRKVGNRFSLKASRKNTNLPMLFRFLWGDRSLLIPLSPATLIDLFIVSKFFAESLDFSE